MLADITSDASRLGNQRWSRGRRLRFSRAVLPTPRLSPSVLTVKMLALVLLTMSSLAISSGFALNSHFSSGEAKFRCKLALGAALFDSARFCVDIMLDACQRDSVNCHKKKIIL